MLRAEQLSSDAKDEGSELSTLLADLEHVTPQRYPGDTASLLVRARFEVRAGRRAEAEPVWLNALRRSDVDPATVAEGAAFLARRGSVEAASFAADRVFTEPTLVREASEIRAVVDQRHRLASQIDDVRQRLHDYEARLKGASST